jgi:hypothetical protein
MDDDGFLPFLVGHGRMIGAGGGWDAECAAI